MPKRPLAIIVTCEHAGNCVPEAYAHLFAGRKTLLETHRAYDRGALNLAERIARVFAAPLITTATTRLLIDANRTRQRRSLFSEFSRTLPREIREEVFDVYLAPHRQRIVDAIRRASRNGRGVLHVAAHTFTPVRRGHRRTCDVGLLYDPARGAESAFCTIWKRAFRQLAPKLRVRRNYPFRGKNDGLTAWLRRHFRDPRYLGIELELNQRFVRRGPAVWTRIQEQVVTVLDAAWRTYCGL